MLYRCKEGPYCCTPEQFFFMMLLTVSFAYKAIRRSIIKLFWRLISQQIVCRRKREERKTHSPGRPAQSPCLCIEYWRSSAIVEATVSWQRFLYEQNGALALKDWKVMSTENEPPPVVLSTLHSQQLMLMYWPNSWKFHQSVTVHHPSYTIVNIGHPTRTDWDNKDPIR